MHCIPTKAGRGAWLLIALTCLSGCQLTPWPWLSSKEAEPVAVSEPAPVLISSAVGPIIPQMQEEFLLQPEVTVRQPASVASLRTRDAQAALQIFDHVLAFQLPKGWQQTEVQGRTGYLKFAYRAPDADSRQEKLLIEGFANYNRHYSARNLLASYVNRAKARCRHAAIYEPLGETQLNGHHGVEAIYGCQANVGEPGVLNELTYLLVIEADSHLYLVNKTLIQHEAALNAANLEQFLAPNLPIQFCSLDQYKAGCTS